MSVVNFLRTLHYFPIAAETFLYHLVIVDVRMCITCGSMHCLRRAYIVNALENYSICNVQQSVSVCTNVNAPNVHHTPNVYIVHAWNIETYIIYYKSLGTPNATR